MIRAAFLAAAVLLAAPAGAETLNVGPDERYKLPSEAFKAATDGDTVEIAEGEYFDCSRVMADNLTIVGLGAGAALTDSTCDGKGLLIVRGNDVTIRNMGFLRARVPDGNGAGIRAEGRNLTVEKSRFVNNQSAILAAPSPHSVITIKTSTFEDSGICSPDGRCNSVIQIGDIARLRIEKSTVTAARGGFLVVSNARRTELYGNTLTDGPNGKSAGLVQVAIGALVMEENTLQKTAPYANRAAAVFVLPNNGPVGDFAVRRNTYSDRSRSGSALVINYSAADPAMSGNTMVDGGDELSTDGYLRYRAGRAYRETKDMAFDTARFLKRSAKLLLGR